MKKTLFLFAEAFSRYSGGIQNIAYYMHKFFSCEGYKVKGIATTNGSEDSIKNTVYESKGNNVSKVYKNSILYCRLIKEASEYGSKTIALSWRSAIVPYICRRITGVEYIVLCHGNDVLPYNKGLKNFFEQKLRKAILLNAQYLCCNSKYTEGLTKEIIQGKVKTMVIHPCSGEDIVRKKNKLATQQFLLSICRIEQRKGCQFVVDAMVDLQTSYPDLKYYIAGNGPYSDELKQYIASKEMDDRCIMLGRISEDEKHRLLDDCALLVMPSYFNKAQKSVEGFGMVYIEANAHGKPVIGSRSGGIEDAIIDGVTGVLIDEKNVVQLKEAISSILNRQICIDKNRCYEWAEKHFYKNIFREYLPYL